MSPRTTGRCVLRGVAYACCCAALLAAAGCRAPARTTAAAHAAAAAANERREPTAPTEPAAPAEPPEPDEPTELGEVRWVKADRGPVQPAVRVTGTVETAADGLVGVDARRGGVLGRPPAGAAWPAAGARVERGDQLAEVLDESGKRWPIRAPATATVVRAHARPGATVRRGAILWTLARADRVRLRVAGWDTARGAVDEDTRWQARIEREDGDVGPVFTVAGLSAGDGWDLISTDESRAHWAALPAGAYVDVWVRAQRRDRTNTPEADASTGKPEAEPAPCRIPREAVYGPADGRWAVVEGEHGPVRRALRVVSEGVAAVAVEIGVEPGERVAVGNVQALQALPFDRR